MHGVAEFVMISSDKAVHPASIMGATKRLAELLVRSLQPEGGRVCLGAFRQCAGQQRQRGADLQRSDRRGGPITVTHPEMRRYFMTIPEACQLVLQASTMGKGSRDFCAGYGRAGQDCRSGAKPDPAFGAAAGDIRSHLSARAPAKIYEELNLDGEATLSTYHPKIKIFRGSDAQRELAAQLNHLRALCLARDENGLLAALRRLVPDYTPGFHLTRSTTRPEESHQDIAVA